MRRITRRAFLGSTIVGTAAFAAINPNIALAVTVAEKQAEANAVSAKLADWSMQLDLASDQYFTALEEHDAAVAAMGEQQVRIDSAEATIATLQTHLSSRASAMYKEGSMSFIEVLLGASSFTQFVNNWDFLNSLNEADADAVEQSKQARAEAQDARDQYALQEQTASDKMLEAENVKIEAEGIVASYQAELNGLDAEVAALIDVEKALQAANAPASASDAAAAAAEAVPSGGGEASAPSDGGGGYVAPSNPEPAPTPEPEPEPDYGGDDGGGGSGGGDWSAADAIVNAAWTQIGVPYVWGGTTPYGGLDCSGLTQYCHRCAGISIPRTSGAQLYGGRWVDDDPQPGDICWTSGHVAIYIGGGQMIEAQQTGVPVKVSRVRVTHYVRYW